jgi:hypothetical protein
VETVVWDWLCGWLVVLLVIGLWRVCDVGCDLVVVWRVVLVCRLWVWGIMGDVLSLGGRGVLGRCLCVGSAC